MSNNLENTNHKVNINLMEKGPYLIKGRVTITDEQGENLLVSGKDMVALCRCGHSLMKPFCDGNHERV